jgi:hypothetical protein
VNQPVVALHQLAKGAGIPPLVGLDQGLVALDTTPDHHQPCSLPGKSDLSHRDRSHIRGKPAATREVKGV